MSYPNRAHERVAASLPARLQICDPETLRPLSASVEGEIVDISLGGVRVVFSELPSALANALAPGITLGMAPIEKGIVPHRVVHLKIAWFKARIEEGSASQASLGASYTEQTPAADRGALLEFAKTRIKGARATERGRQRRIAAAAVGVIGLVLLLAKVEQLRGEVEEQGALIQSLRAQLARATEHTAPAHGLQPPVERARVEVPSTVQRPLVEVSPAQVERPSNAQPARPAMAPAEAGWTAPPPAFLAYKVDVPLEDVEVVSVELLNGDLVGSLSSKATSAKKVVVSIGYACEGKPDGGVCACQTPEMTLPPGRRSEFACTPLPPLKSERIELLVSIKAQPPPSKD